MSAAKRVRAAEGWRISAGVTHDLVPDRNRQHLHPPTGSSTER